MLIRVYFQISLKDGNYAGLDGLDPTLNWEGSSSAGDIDLSYGIESAVRPTTDVASLPRNVWGKASTDVAGWGVSARAEKDMSAGDATAVEIDANNDDADLSLRVVASAGSDFSVDSVEATKGLDLDNLVDILTVPKNSIMKQYRRLFAIDDVKFHVSECGLREIAQTAYSRGTGARGLRSITDQVLMETQYVVPSLPDVHTVYVDAAAVRGERKPILLKDPAMTGEKYEALMKNGEDVGEAGMPVHIDEDDEGDREEAA